LRQSQRPAGQGEFRGRPSHAWSFRLHQPGAAGTPPLPVQLVGEYVDGDLRDGDWVELPAGWRPGKPIRSLINLSTGEHITVRTIPATTHVVRAVSVAGVIAVLIFIAWAASIVLTNFQFPI
jgi:hypothetical protein